MPRVNGNLLASEVHLVALHCNLKTIITYLQRQYNNPQHGKQCNARSGETCHPCTNWAVLCYIHGFQLWPLAHQPYQLVVGSGVFFLFSHSIPIFSGASSSRSLRPGIFSVRSWAIAPPKRQCARHAWIRFASILARMVAARRCVDRMDASLAASHTYALLMLLHVCMVQQTSQAKQRASPYSGKKRSRRKSGKRRQKER